MRYSKYNKILTKNFLYKEYIVNKKSTYQIAKEIGCSNVTIWKRIKKENIILRGFSEARKMIININRKESKLSKILTKSFLTKEYIEKKKSTHQIAKEVDCSFSTISLFLIKHNIKPRTKSEAQLGNANHMYIDNRTNKEYYCIDCGEEVSLNSGFYNKGRCYPCHCIFITGKNNPNYIHGKGYLPYPSNFNNQLKKSIRQRDNYICQKCGITEEAHLIVYGQVLSVHHIDYDKENCEEHNLITLCFRCNIKVNKNRKYWTVYFQNKIIL